jgi:hypothetical protein
MEIDVVSKFSGFEDAIFENAKYANSLDRIIAPKVNMTFKFSYVSIVYR